MVSGILRNIPNVSIAHTLTNSLSRSLRSLGRA